MTETEFQKQVTDLAEILGWSWVHFRPAQTSKGWRTPVSGPLGKGWVDLVLVRERDRRLIFAELKRDGGKLTPEQRHTLVQLARLQDDEDSCDCGLVKGVDFAHTWSCAYNRTAASLQVWVWHPADFDEIVETLQ